jgi:type II secretory pathway pseudopilin PulG
MSPYVHRPRHLPALLRLLSPLPPSYHSGQKPQDMAAGLTLIEGLVAIVVIAITVSAITPPIFVATATRIQTRRSEQAREIAQGELDRVRTLMERGGATINDMPGATAADVDVGGALTATKPAEVVVPETTVPSSPMLSSQDCGGSIKRYPDTSTTPVAFNRLTPVDITGDCTPEYAMQVFRLPGYIPIGGTAPLSFIMGVRVYSYFPGQVYPPLDAAPSSLAMTTGRRDAGGKQRPLAVLYSQVSRNDSSGSLGLICRQNGGADCQKNE